MTLDNGRIIIEYDRLSETGRYVGTPGVEIKPQSPTDVIPFKLAPVIQEAIAITVDVDNAVVFVGDECRLRLQNRTSDLFSQRGTINGNTGECREKDGRLNLIDPHGTKNYREIIPGI